MTALGRKEIEAVLHKAEREISYQIGGNKIRLGKRRQGYNPFIRFFFGEMEGTVDGTVMRGEFRIHPFVQGFLLLWFGGLILIGLLPGVFNLYTTLAFRGNVAQAVAGVVMPIILLGFGYGMVRAGQKLSRKDEEWLICFLKERLGAEHTSHKE